MIRFVAKRNDGKEARVAYYARRPDNSVWVVARRGVERENDTEIVNPESNEETKEGIWTLELSAQLDVAVYEDAWAEVLIYADPEAEEAPVVGQVLQDD